MSALRFTLVALAVLTASTAFALMPPHVTRVSPGTGQALYEGRIVKFHGYSLPHGDEVQVTDGEGNRVDVQTFMWTRQECQGRPGACSGSGPVAPGAQQTYSVLSVKLPAPAENVRYQLELLGTQVDVATRDGAYVIAGDN